MLTCLLLGSISAFAQTKTVTGTVTDAANEPLIGASVLVQGTSTGTITDMDGKYSISVTPRGCIGVFIRGNDYTEYQSRNTKHN